jgi:hypothetical protein
VVCGPSLVANYGMSDDCLTLVLFVDKLRRNRRKFGPLRRILRGREDEGSQFHRGLAAWDLSSGAQES